MLNVSEFLNDANYQEALLALDCELRDQVKAGGCGLCSGKLDVADYDRKPRGPCPSTLESDKRHSRRLSLCCRGTGCRTRAQPPSVRFLGRRVFRSVVVVLGALLRQGPKPWHVAQLSSVLGADRRTLSRWRRWWIERVGNSRAFEIGRADFMPPPVSGSLPSSLFNSFTGTATERMVSLLSFLSEYFGARFPTDQVPYAELAR